MGYPLGQVRSAVLAVSSPNSLCIPSLLGGGTWREAETALTLCEYCEAITKTSQLKHVGTTVFITDLKTWSIQAAMKKLTLSQLRPA